MTSDMPNLQGSIVAIVTPFQDDESIDYEAFEKLLKFHLDNNTNGIVVCGTTGETPTLSDKEYKEIVKFTVDYVDGRIPVIAGAGTNSTVKTVRNCKIVKRLGVDGLLIVGPYYNKPTPKGFYIHYSQIAQAVDLPIIVYNVPGRTGKNIPTDTLLQLAEEFENIIAVKEASGDISQIMDILSRKPAGFKVFSGDDALAYLIVALGGDGCISVVANEIPSEFSKMIKLALDEKYSAARAIHFKYLDLMNMNFIESNPQPVKTILHMMGLIEENFRSPMCRVTDESKATLLKLALVLELVKSNKS